MSQNDVGRIPQLRNACCDTGGIGTIIQEINGVNRPSLSNGVVVVDNILELETVEVEVVSRLLSVPLLYLLLLGRSLLNGL